MQTFSERMGYTKPKFEQIDSLDEETRNQIWNLFYSLFNDYSFQNSLKERYLLNVWSVFLKKPLDAIPKDSWNTKINETWVKSLALKDSHIRLLDFIEFSIFHWQPSDTVLAFNPKAKEFIEKFIININYIFEKENVGYRIINNLVTPITSSEEIVEIETALEQSQKTVSQHIHQALKLLADRENPDYRNSIKESISAVESLVKILVPKGEFADALKTLKARGVIADHSAFEAAFSKLYGWASDAGGIRHGKADFGDASKEEARYMVIVCSAFVNYLIAKEGKAIKTL